LDSVVPKVSWRAFIGNYQQVYYFYSNAWNDYPQLRKSGKPWIKRWNEKNHITSIKWAIKLPFWYLRVEISSEQNPDKNRGTTVLGTKFSIKKYTYNI